jgi:TolB-like protein/Tfp pilus assembly protein PilF
LSLFNELKRRNVFRVAIAYIIAAWLVMQFADVILNNIDAPSWVFQTVLLLLGIGLLFAIFFAWAFELTPEGIKKEKDVDRTQSITPKTGRKLDFIIIGILVMALGYFAYDKFVLSADRDAALVEATTQAVTGQGQADPGASAEVEKSIAVLPFVNMSSDEEQEYFSDGLSEELLNMLAKIPELRVAARTSSFSLKGKDLQIAEVGNILKVAHVLEGSVRKSGNQVRITTQLIKADDGYHMWSETYDRTLDNIFAIQDEIAREVVAQLKITLLGNSTPTRQVNPQAYTLFLQARHLARVGTADAMQRAVRLSKEAIAMDPDYPEPWLILAGLYNVLANIGEISLAESSVLRRSAVQKALDIDPNSAAAHASNGNVVLALDNNLALAVQYFNRALQLDPGYTDILNQVAGFCFALGRTDQAIRLFEYAASRDPVNPNLYSALARAYTRVGRYEESVQASKTGLALSPEGTGTHYEIGQALLLSGQAEAALAEFKLETGDDEYRVKGMAMAYHSLGMQQEFEHSFRELRERWGEQWPSEIAHVYAWTGKADAAFEWLDKAIDRKEEGLNLQFLSPYYKSLHSDPRWSAFRERTGFSEARLAAIEFDVEIPGEASQ